MRRRRYALLFVLSILALVAGRWPGKSQVVTHTYQPFTANTVDVFFIGPKSEYVETVQKFYSRKADGSSLHIVYFDGPDGQQMQRMELLDVAGSRRVIADGLTESTTTYGATHDIRARHQKATVCAQNGEPTDTTIHGYNTVKIVQEFTTPGGGGFKFERYHAPSLDCFVLREKAYRTLEDGPGPLVLFQASEVTTLVVGEPDGSLFVLPEGYAERKPTDVLREFGRRYPDHGPSEESLQNLAPLDESHTNSRLP